MAKYALIGEKLGHSYSGIIHNRFFELRGLDDTYDLIEIPKGSLKEEIDRISRSYDGINVTIPYKIDVMPLIGFVSHEAESIGAVNTIRFGDVSQGHNTDYFGLKASLDVNDITVAGKRVVILGTGGVSKAALAVCRDMGAEDITFVSTSKPSLGDYRVITYEDNIDGDVLINCTPVGMYPTTDASPLCTIGSSFGAVVDTIYNPPVTKLMHMAESAGIKTVSGLYMLVAQAIYAQAIWRGEDVDKDIITTIYEEMASR